MKLWLRCLTLIQNTRLNLLRKFCVTAKMERLKFCVGSSQ